jgi:3-dehydroquinate dehydratase-2
MFPGPIIELHITNVQARGAHRNSLVSKVATAIIVGLAPRAIRLRCARMRDLLQ